MNSLFSGCSNSLPFTYMSDFNPSSSFPIDDIRQDNNNEIKTRHYYQRSTYYAGLENVYTFYQLILKDGKDYLMDKFYDYFLNAHLGTSYENYNVISNSDAMLLKLGENVKDKNLNCNRFDYFMTRLLNFKKCNMFYTMKINGSLVKISNPFSTNIRSKPLSQVNISSINHVSYLTKMNRVKDWLVNDVNNNSVNKKMDCFY